MRPLQNSDDLIGHLCMDTKIGKMFHEVVLGHWVWQNKYFRFGAMFHEVVLGHWVWQNKYFMFGAMYNSWSFDSSRLVNF